MSDTETGDDPHCCRRRPVGDEPVEATTPALDRQRQRRGARLPAGGPANPSGYGHKGRRYVVTAAGGHGAIRTEIGDGVIVFTPPAA